MWGMRVRHVGFLTLMLVANAGVFGWLVITVVMNYTPPAVPLMMTRPEGGRATNMPTRPAAGKLTGRANAITRGKGKKKGLRRIMAAPTAAKKKRPKPKR